MIVNSLSEDDLSETDTFADSEPVVGILADNVLLSRFVLDSDETAFAEIVRRHGSLVMAVCRRVVGQAADADDAFQATFLALAHRPRSVRQCRSLTGWLYSVAFRTSVRLVRFRSRHAMPTMPELPVSREPDPLDLIAADREMAVLDEELNRLPEKYRTVLVMNYFDAQTSQQIADQLNESKGIIDGRLRQARNVLRVRLAQRGVALGVISIAAVTQSAASSAASPILIQSTIELGVQALGHPVSFPVNLSRLEPLFKPELTMLRTKLITGILLTAAVIVGGLSAGGIYAGGMSADSSGYATDSGLDESESLIESTLANDPNAESIESVRPSFVTGRQAPDEPTTQHTAARNNYPGYSSAAARQVADQIYRDLADSRVTLDFPGEVKLSELLEMMLESIQGSPPMVPDYAELELEGMTSLEDVVVRNIKLKGVSAESALEIILAQTSDPQLDYIVKNEVLLITTRDAAESDENLFRRVYNVAAVLPLFESDVPMWRVVPMSPRSPGSGSIGSSGSTGIHPTSGQGELTLATDNSKPPSTTTKIQRPLNQSNLPASVVDSSGSMYHYQAMTPLDRLLETVESMSGTAIQWFDIDGEGGRISAMQNSIIVLQTRRGHKAVVDTLEQLEQMAATADQ